MRVELGQPAVLNACVPALIRIDGRQQGGGRAAGDIEMTLSISGVDGLIQGRGQRPVIPITAKIGGEMQKAT